MHALETEPKTKPCSCGGHNSCFCRGGQRDIQRHSHGPSPEPTASIDSVLAQPGQPLPSALRRRFERSFDHDLSDVRLHTDPLAAASADQLNANAWTSGRHIVLAAGQYAPGQVGGDRLLAHELTHVIQQRAAPEGSLPGTGLEYRGDNAAAEAHADGVAARVVSGSAAGPITATEPGIARTPKRKSSVTSVDVNGATKKITFHGAHPRSWALTDFDLDNGDYTATVHLQYTPVSKLILQLQNVAAGTRFQFSYAIMANEPDPMTMVDEGQILPVHATADPNAKRSKAADDQQQVTFKVAVVSEADFAAATGRSASELPDGQLVDGSSYTFTAPGVGFGALGARYPFPANTTGVLWTGSHMSDAAVVEGVPTVRGFRAPFRMHAMAYAERNLGLFGGAAGDTSFALNVGTPGTYAQDYWFMYSPGARLVHQGPIDTNLARGGAETIEAAAEKYNAAYRHSPPPSDNPAFERLSGGDPNYVCMPGQNCINMPGPEHSNMLGGRRMTINPDNPVDITTGNLVSTGEPFEFTSEGGRSYSGPGFARNADIWAKSVSERAAEGLTSTPIFSGMVVRGVLHTGGRVLLLYGIYESGKRILGASDDELPAVVVEEGATWLGGWVGSTLSAATLGAVACSETGPGAVICSAAFGIAGGIAGAIFGRNVAQEFIENAAGIGELLRNPAQLSNTATLMFGTPEGKRIMWQSQREEREARGENPGDF